MNSLKRYISVLMVLLPVLFVSTVWAEEVYLGLETGAAVVQGEEVRIPVLATAVDAERSIAGAAFSVEFTATDLTFLGAESSFFGTFASHNISPTSVGVDNNGDGDTDDPGETYTSPLVTNPDAAPGLAMIAAARPTPGIIPAGDSAILFELIFEAAPGAAVGDTAVILTASTINNTDAGYDAGGETIAALIDADLSLAPDDPNAFPELDVAFGTTMVAVFNANDRDGDNLSNDDEALAGTDPDNADSDGDGVSDFDELNPGGMDPRTDPLLADTDGDGALDGHELAAGTDPTLATDFPAFVIATYNTTLTDQWAVLNFGDFEGPVTDFANPVVVGNPAGTAAMDADATFVQIRNIDAAAGTFEARLNDVSTGDYTHASEQVDFIAVETGSFAITQGDSTYMVFAETLTSKGQTQKGKLEKVKFPSKFFKQNPVVLASVTSSNDLNNPVEVRVSKPSKTGFSFVLQEEQLQETVDPAHGPEQVSYLAIEPFVGIAGDFVIETRTDKKAVTDAPATITTEIPTTAMPTFIGQMQSFYDKDPATLRLDDFTPVVNTVFVFVAEDTTADAEEVHKAEDLGMMFLSPVTSDDSDGDSISDLEEYFTYGTSSTLADTDGDGIDDGEEINAIGSDPLLADTDGDGFSDGHEVFAIANSNGGDPNDPAVTPGFIYHTEMIGVSKLAMDAWQTQMLPAGKFFDPVIVATPATMDTGVSNIIQIQNIDATTDSYEIRLNGEPGAEYGPDQVQIMVVDKGIYTLNNGAKVVAGMVDSTPQTKAAVKQKVKFSFPKTFKLKQNPAVFASVASANEEASPVTVRIDKPSKTGFSFIIQEFEQQDIQEPGHGTETFCYIAVEPFMDIIDDGDGNENVIEVGIMKNAVTDQPSVIPSGLASVIPVAPDGFVANTQSFLEKDPGVIRLIDLVADSANIIFVEDPSLNAPDAHKAETVGYMFFTDVAGSPDTDGDNLSDIFEYFTSNTDATLADTDGDGLNDDVEWNGGTPSSDPLLADTDGDGFSDGQEVFSAASGADPNDPDAMPSLYFEVGKITDLTSTQQQITFSNTFWNPVVVAVPVGGNGAYDMMDPAAGRDVGDPTFIQIYGVDQDSFYIRLLDMDGSTHPEETMVHWIAMDAGHFDLEGKKVFAGKLNSSAQTKANKFEKIKFASKFFSATPTVFASINGVGEPILPPAAVRLDKVSKAGFSFTLQESSDNQANDPGHPAETISVIAMDTMLTIINDVVVEVGTRAKAFDSDFDDGIDDGFLNFDKSHYDIPLFLADMQTAYDKDSAQLRITDVNNDPAELFSNDMVEMFVQEDDTIGDGNTAHTKPETVGYFATSTINPLDTDGDNLEDDYEELVYMTDPNEADTDGDGRNDDVEIAAGTDPLVKDSDGDGAGDGHEALAGTDPLNVGDVPSLFFEKITMTIDGDWAEISPTASFADPIFVASSSSATKYVLDGEGMPQIHTQGIPAIVQIRQNGISGNYEIRTRPTVDVNTGVRPPAVDQTVYITVIERGIFSTPEGNVFVANSVDYQQAKKAKYLKVKFPTTYKIGKSSVVFASVTSNDSDDNPIYHRLNAVSKTGFSFMFQEEEGLDQVLPEAETLSYIAIGCSSTTGTTGVAAAVVDGVAKNQTYYTSLLKKMLDGTNSKSLVIFDVVNPADPSSENVNGFMIDMQSTLNKDPANVRFNTVWVHGSDPAVDPPFFWPPFISEDQAMDTEVVHPLENIGIISISDVPAPL